MKKIVIMKLSELLSQFHVERETKQDEISQINSFSKGQNVDKTTKWL